MENPVQLTPRFTEALDYARQVHVSLRKGTQVPYMANLLGVASLVRFSTIRCKTKVACQGCAILKLILASKSPESWKVVLIVSNRTPTRNRSGSSASLLTSNGYGASRLTLCLCPLRTNCTTPEQFWRTTDKSAPRSGVGSSEDANSSCGISMNSSKFMKRTARNGGLFKN